MNSVNSLATYASAHLRPLPIAAPQQSGNAITLQQALARGITADQLRAVANWNERKSYAERRRKARARHKAQATALRVVAEQMETIGRGGIGLLSAHLRGAGMREAA